MRKPFWRRWAERKLDELHRHLHELEERQEARFEANPGLREEVRGPVDS